MDTTEVLEAPEVKQNEFVARKAIVFAVPKEFAIPRDGTPKMPTEMYVGETKRYAPGFAFGFGSVLRGLDIDTEKKVPAFAQMLGTNTTSPNWEQKIDEFWSSYLVQIPIATITYFPGTKEPKVEGSREIDASYEIRGDGFIYPVNIDDYLLYETMMKDNHDDKIAISSSDYKYAEGYEFFCVTKEDEKKRQNSILKDTMQLYLEITNLINEKDNTEKLQHVVGLLSPDITALAAMRLTKEECMTIIFELKETKGDKLLKAINDPDLAMRAFLRQVTDAGLLTKTGDNYFLDEKLLGNMKETIKSFRTPEGSSVMTSLKNRLKIQQEYAR
jgi:hypothetical protein